MAVVVVGLSVTPAAAQYFGQNKVQYKAFDFRVLRTEHFDIHFYGDDQRGVELAARMAERWHARLSRFFGHTLSGRQPLILYASATDFQQTNVIGGQIGEGTGGVTESLQRRIVLPFAGPLADTDHVIGHELVHAFQYDIAALRATGGRVAGIGLLPLWFIEGMAEYASIGARSPLTAMWVRDAVAREALPTIAQLDDPQYFPYRWGHALWAYIGGRWGDERVAELLGAAIESGSPAQAFALVLGLDADALTAAWHEALRDAFVEATTTRVTPDTYGRALMDTTDRIRAQLNVSPALSPDGQRIAFLSERSLFSVDLYVADVTTGRILRRLTSTAVDPHVESLQFIASAGTWHPNGRQLAVTAVAGGRPVLNIYDVESGAVREVSLPGLDGALTPAWAADGRRVALVGVSGGVTDLFVLDLESGALTRLTNDAYGELQPAWSPDGTRIVVSTDRFTTNLDELRLGALQLAVIDVGSATARPVSAGARGKQLGASFGRGGQLYFVGDADGTSNVYRADLDTGNVTRITAVPTGVSGITESSPALSSSGDRLAFSIFTDGSYRLRIVDSATEVTPVPAAADVDTAQLPPRQSRRAITSLLDDTSRGLPAAGAIAVDAAEPYRPRLRLNFVGQPTIGVGVDRYGAVGGGSVALGFADLLGDHNLTVAFQASASFDRDFSANDLGGGVMYLNQKRRWNWGVVVDQTPYRTGFISEALANIDGEPAVVEQTTISRQADRGISGVVAYPFNRAQRLEFSAGIRQLRFDEFVRTRAFSLATGALLLDERADLDDIEGLDLGQASAALVYDTSVFGATSPVLGQRYRAEVAPVLGSIRYTNVLTDYRRYFMPARLYTVAARVLHSGRYGSDAEDPRLFPLFIGYPSLVRGYDVGTFEARECESNTNGECPAFARLIGSRMLVANLELRFPLLRPFGVTDRVYGPVPAEVALFADGGVAWSRASTPEMFGGDRQAVSSAGAAVRVNAFGYAVVQLSLAKPFQRAGRGWIFQFSLSPGF